MSNSSMALNNKGVEGLNKKLTWGIIAVFIFMVGDGVEQAFLSKYLVDLGFTVGEAALVFSVYGITLTIASWLAGVLSEMFGPRRVMLAGLLIWVVFHIGLLTFGLEAKNYGIILLMYGFRGFGYPLFALSFYVWIAKVVPNKRLGTIMGWFWFAYAGGLGFIGAYYPSFSIPKLGYMGTLWSALVFIILGGILGVLMVKSGARQNLQESTNSEKGKLKSFLKAITIVYENPKIGVVGLLRTINTTAQYGFVVVLPLYFTSVIGFTISQWLIIWGSMSAINMFFCVIWGYVGDRFGRRFVITWFGCVGSAITTLLFYYLPLAFGEVFWVAIMVSMLYGVTLAAFCPLGALVPGLESKNTGAAMSILNLGAGLSTFIGPSIVGLIGGENVQAVMWTFACLYIVGAFLSIYLKANREESINTEKEIIAG
ncbi:MFS transporter [Metabacillus litoralis]|jgi:polyol permease family|uniref:MFS transporter n=1 Tax=Metabacillus litoralis TaxID=152268 RepID=UPI00203C2CDC|nr:MFS transporter [Metabacillus litoralis]MCM3653369.1 MFS transporter [Metabacillus litoralis]